MAEHTSERRRWRHLREGDDLPKAVREAEGGVEVQEREAGVREVSETRGSVEHRLGAALRELEAREGREKTTSWKLRRAFDDLERREQRKESTEAKLREALKSIKDDEDSVQLTLEAAVQLGGTEAARSKCVQEGSDADQRHQAEDVEGSSQVISKEVSEHKPEVHTGPQKDDSRISRVKFESMEEIDKAIKQHTYVKDGLSEENYEECRQYFRVVAEGSGVHTKDIAEAENLGEQVVENWRNGGAPRIIHAIKIHEIHRLEHESEIPREALNHRIAPDDVHEAVSHLREGESHSIKELVGFVEEIQKKIGQLGSDSVHYAELYDSQEPLTKDRLREIALEIRSNREVIQSELNVHLGFNEVRNYEVRIGVTDSRLYYWHVNTSLDKWVNVLADQKFYMSKEDKRQLIDEARLHLHIRGGGAVSEYYLNDLLNQLSRLEKPAANRIGRYGKVQSLDGEILHFIGDIQGKSLEDFESMITHMGTRKAARVSNPKFPDIHEYRTKFVAIIGSDGHVDAEGKISYYEKNIERRNIAMGVLQEFGNFEVKVVKENGIQVNLPRLLGSMADYWGIPRGDRAIHNRGLHESIINENLDVKKLYLEEMVPEEGCICGTVVSVTRNHVLHAGKRAEVYREKYGIRPLVSQEHIDLVRESGTLLEKHLTYKPREVVYLPYWKLTEMAESEKIEVSRIANSLIEIINENPNELLRDEMESIAGPLGISMARKVGGLYYYQNSKRLSVTENAGTRKKQDAIRWVLIAPPNHPSKKDRAIDLIRSNQDQSSQIAREIERDGLSVHPFWEEYLTWKKQ